MHESSMRWKITNGERYKWEIARAVNLEWDPYVPVAVSQDVRSWTDRCQWRQHTAAVVQSEHRTAESLQAEATTLQESGLGNGRVDRRVDGHLREGVRYVGRLAEGRGVCKSEKIHVIILMPCFLLCIITILYLELEKLHRFWLCFECNFRSLTGSKYIISHYFRDILIMLI